MGLRAFLEDKLALVACLVLGLASADLVLFVLGLDASALAGIDALVGGFGALGLLLEYLRRRSFYRQLSQALEQLDEAYLVAELVDRPEFAEGIVLYDALAAATKAMNDRLGAYRIASRDYREYIELWIHEVKTPIAAAHLVAQNHPSPEMRAVDGELARIDGYVEQALYYARSSSVEGDYRIREISLKDAVNAALRSQARALIDARIAPELGALDFVVYADIKWLTFILGQVLVNSAKYRKSGEGPARIELSAREFETGLDTAHVVLRIEDHGVGMPPEDVARVFEKGFTGENGRAFSKSTGIGLYLCRELCSKMGLGISLESEQGVGTTVFLEFPLSRVRLLERDAAADGLTKA